DRASRQRYVETVSGKGYRFIAPVTQAASVPLTSTTEGPPLPATLLSTLDELPTAPTKLVRVLFLLVQILYLGFYLTALSNMREVDEIFTEGRLLPPAVLMVVLVTTAAVLIPVRLFLIAAAAFDLRQLPAKFARMFPILLLLDLLWALSPFLLV